MASLKIILYKSKKLKNGEHPIMLRIIQNRKIKYINLGYSLQASQWDSKQNIPNKKYKNSQRLRTLLLQRLLEADAKLIELEKEIPNPSINQIMDVLVDKKEEKQVLAFWKNKIEDLIAAGKSGNASAYKNTLSVYSQFRDNKELTFSELNYKEVLGFEKFLLNRGLSTNGISFHMRTVRAVYNKAIKEGFASKDNYPFDSYSIKREKTIHRALIKEEISTIKNFDSEGNEALDLAKDYFMFSFYLRGISFIDMVYLQVRNISNGRLNYKRAKTKDVFSIEIPDEAMQIILKYNDLKKKDSYIFPAIKSKENHYRDYKNAMRLTNKKLKLIGELTNCSIPLTTYVARHSWATIAKRAGISTAIISESLGHETEEITQVYLDSFENNVLDEANKKIINLI